MRGFGTYLYERGLTEFHLGSTFSIKVPSWKKLHVGFTQEEAAAIISGIDRSTTCGKRDYAILMLALHTGLRGIDLLKLDLHKHQSGLAPVEAQRYIPHIFSLEELKRFFQAADSQPILPRSRLRHLQIPVIFRLMYTCGLRPHEARLIEKEHVNLLEGTIFIPESKGHKNRIVVMPPEMTSICSKYVPFAVHEFPNSPYLFPCQRFKGAAYNGSWLTKVFHLCWDEAGIGKVAGNAPRPYDFWHTRAIHLYRGGMPLSILSEFLGHVSRRNHSSLCLC